MKKRPRIGILGGSFNPPHLAHLLLALLYLEARPGASIWVIPCHRHPFAKPLAPYPLRRTMCRLAFASLGRRVKVVDTERQLGGVSYTARTLEFLRRRYPRLQFELIVGSDLLAESEKWKNFSWISGHFPLFVVQRGGRKAGELALPPLSSSLIRRRLARGQAIDRLVSPAVERLIRRRRLYAHREKQK